ncbi:lysosomal enzyme trafficking factor-like [Symsagittifera roscoffensis]|uniref:lysosomal enzyme trafficking factor-like n=1 Tax=Symsagittifera roscoffensis TaxID=84072 RepID=UPI00307B9AE5
MSKLQGNTRQTVSWVLLLMYLGGTFYLMHYLFDISDQYSQLALDHAKHYKKKDRQLLGIYDMIAEHMFNVPFSWWIVILLVPYISIFALLITCTRTNCVLLGDKADCRLPHVKVDQTFKAGKGAKVK